MQFAQRRTPESILRRHRDPFARRLPSPPAAAAFNSTSRLSLAVIEPSAIPRVIAAFCPNRR
ncbi:MAG: hypothetical protein U0528_11020 [Anaerolineae bacterium]